MVDPICAVTTSSSTCAPDWLFSAGAAPPCFWQPRDIYAFDIKFVRVLKKHDRGINFFGKLIACDGHTAQIFEGPGRVEVVPDRESQC